MGEIPIGLYNNKITMSNKAPPSGILHKFTLTKWDRTTVKRRSQKTGYFASNAPLSFVMITSDFSGKRSFTNYVDKKRWVGSPKY